MPYIGSFNANDHEPVDFSALPAGEYTVSISNSEFRNTKNGRGQYLSLTFEIIEGQHAGRYAWHNLNLQNDNPKAVEIAQRELSAICRAVGKMAISDSSELHDIPHRITLAYIPARGEWAEKNQIKKWMPLSAAAPAQAAKPQPVAPSARVAPPPVAPAAPAAPSTPPWKRSSAPPSPGFADHGTKAEAVADDIPY